MPELFEHRPVRLDPTLLAMVGETDPTVATLEGLEPHFPFAQLSPPTWFELGEAHRRITGTHVHCVPSGTPSPLTLSLVDVSRGAHFGTTVFTSALGLKPPAFSDTARCIFLTGEEFDYVIGSEAASQIAAVHPPDHAGECLRELFEWTRMTPAELAPLIGSRRRTVYHWLAEGAIGVRSASRIVELHSRLGPLALSRDPLLVRAWLLAGDPCPADLAAAQRWDDLEARVTDALRPLEPAMDGTDSTAVPDELSPPRDVVQAALLAFVASPARTVPQRFGWHPRELTGIQADEVDEQSDH